MDVCCGQATFIQILNEYKFFKTKLYDQLIDTWKRSMRLMHGYDRLQVSGNSVTTKQEYARISVGIVSVPRYLIVLK